MTSDRRPGPQAPEPSPRKPPSLSEKVLLIEAMFGAAQIPHAFGGAIALAYYATPRATIDIDVNVFIESERSADVLKVLEGLGADAPSPAESVRLNRDGQARIRWGATPIDLFFSYDAFHDVCMERRRLFPFGEGAAIHVLAPEDLVVFKAIFDRGKDWRDIDEVVFAMADELDEHWVDTWLDRIVGTDDERFQKWRDAASRSTAPSPNRNETRA